MSVNEGDAVGTIVSNIPESSQLKRRWLWVAIAVTLVVLAGGAVVFWKWTTNSSATTNGKSSTITANDLDTVQSQANLALRQSGLQAALAIYNKDFPKAANKSVQGQLYEQAAGVALNNNAVSTALDYALKADSDLHNSGSSSFVAAIYQQQGNNAAAVTYYNKAAAEAPPLSQARGSGKEYYLHAAQAAQEAEQ